MSTLFMKKKFTLFEYLSCLFCESFVISLLFEVILCLVIYYNPQSTFRGTLLVSVFLLGFIYLIIKIFSKVRLNNPYLSMLPVSYLLSFYGVHFIMFLEHATKSSDYTDQLALFTLFFIIVTIIDKVIDNFLEITKEK